jgi:3-isopropylmalate/(R)-2-methylmalate dehydratase small subunit
MNPFSRHTGIVAGLNRANVDTDQIIPKQFLKSIQKTGYGPNAFFDWRYRPNGMPDPDFELNHPRYQGRSILVTKNNFGCGSSREHAVWALVQDGYKAVIAPWKATGGNRLPGFADIFRNNAAKNGLLAIELSEPDVDVIFGLLGETERLKATVDLERQTVTVHAAQETIFPFEIDQGTRERLLKGLDDIALTLRHEADITRFEAGYDPMITLPA